MATKIKKKHLIKSNKLAAEALKLHQTGNISSAIIMYEKALEINPDEIAALHNLAILLSENNQRTRAIDLLKRLLKNNPNNEIANETLGRLYYEKGFPIDAENHLIKALKKNPNNIKACHLMAMSLASRRQYDLAESYFIKTLEIDDNYEKAICNYAKLKGLLHDFDEAESLFLKSLNINPDFIAAKIYLVDLYIEQEKYNDAKDYLLSTLIEDNTNLELLTRLGNVYSSLEDYESAVETYEKTIQINQNYLPAYDYLGNHYVGLGLFDKALNFFQQALKIDNNNIEIHADIANLYKQQCNIDKAIEHIQIAIKLDKEKEAHSSVGQFLDKTLESKLIHEDDPKNIAIPESTANLHSMLGTFLLAKGEYENGWLEYQWRFNTGDVKWPVKDKPLWQGESLDNKALLIWHEQGLGDSIQFIRYVNKINKGSGKIILLTDKKLLDLFKQINCIDEFILELNPDITLDYHFPMASLPIILNKTDTLIDSVPYLSFDIDRKKYWADRLNDNDKFRVGIVWSGNPKYRADKLRSPGLDVIAPILDNSNIAFYSLQRGEGKLLLDNHPAANKIIDLTDEIADFYDDAAFIQNLDLVITSDTSTVHLAGALDIETWCLLPYSPDWRWKTSGSRCDWYNSVYLIRQPKYKDWDSVINVVKEKLNLLAHE